MKIAEQDFYQITESVSYIINGYGKSGKMTLFFYMMLFLFKKKALIFTAQEAHLFKRRIESLSQQYKQFEKLDENMEVFYLKEDWKTLKQRYGFEFFIKELTHTIIQSEEELIVMHRFGELFEFQDRYEIQNVYSSLVKVCYEHGKKIIFIANRSHENFDQINKISDEFSDVSIRVDVDDATNERIIHIRDLFHNKEYPPLKFQILRDSFLLDYFTRDEESQNEIVKNILICELDKAHDNFFDICQYIFNKPGFHIKRATSLNTILQEMFISPDVIIVLMKRTEENFETVKSIKMHLPNSPVIAILDQDFVRAEDAHKAYSYGVDELFSTDLALDKLILACQKASKIPFYTEAMKELPHFPNILENLDDMRIIADICMETAIFFTVFVFNVAKDSKMIKPSREYDYVYREGQKLYYLALNTAPKDVNKIMQKFESYELVCLWEPINHTSIEDCLK